MAVRTVLPSAVTLRANRATEEAEWSRRLLVGLDLFQS